MTDKIIFEYEGFRIAITEEDYKCLKRKSFKELIAYIENIKKLTEEIK